MARLPKITREQAAIGWEALELFKQKKFQQGLAKLKRSNPKLYQANKDIASKNVKYDLPYEMNPKPGKEKVLHRGTSSTEHGWIPGDRRDYKTVYVGWEQAKTATPHELMNIGKKPGDYVRQFYTSTDELVAATYSSGLKRPTDVKDVATIIDPLTGKRSHFSKSRVLADASSVLKTPKTKIDPEIERMMHETAAKTPGGVHSFYDVAGKLPTASRVKGKIPKVGAGGKHFSSINRKALSQEAFDAGRHKAVIQNIDDRLVPSDPAQQFAPNKSDIHIFTTPWRDLQRVTPTTEVMTRLMKKGIPIPAIAALAGLPQQADASSRKPTRSRKGK